MRIPYELVAIQADALIIRMTLSLDSRWWQQYIFFLDACGWTDKEYDQETLRRIDAAWDFQIWN
jgi:hypothetical protein